MSQALQTASVEQRILALSDSAKVALVLCAPSARFGGNWGFMHKTDELYRNNIEILRRDSANIKGIQVTNGLIILANDQFLVGNINAVVPNGIDGDFIKKVESRKFVEKKRFEKFASDVREDKSSYVTHNPRGYKELTIGIYSFNDSKLMSVNGKNYPAFNLTLQEILNMSNLLATGSQKVYAKAINRSEVAVFDEVFNLASNSNGIRGLYKALTLAKSKHGVFLTLRIA